MRSFLIIGGFIGFLLSLVLGLAQGSSWPIIFWRSSVAALVGGLVMRWWGGIWIKSLWEAQRERQDARKQHQHAPASPPVANPSSE